MNGIKIKTVFGNALHVLPLFIPSYTATLGICLVLLLLFDRFNGLAIALVSTISMLLTVAFFWSFRKRLKMFALERSFLVDCVVLLVVAGWVGINMRYASQSVFITRDPGVYTVAGKWLQTNSTTDVKTVDLNLDVKTARTESSGMWQDLVDKSRNTLQPQGMHLLPAFLGLSARMFGEPAIYVTNAVLGGVALLAVYALSRLILRPKYSWLPVVVLAASLPMIYFSRDSYTEPLAMAFVFSGITLLSVAIKSVSKKSLWLLAGLLLGASTLTRPDTYLVGASVVIAMIIFFSRNHLQKKETKLAATSIGLFFVSYLGVVLLAWLDIKRLTRVYFIGHGKGIVLQLILLAVVSIAGILLFTFWRRLKLQRVSDYISQRAFIFTILTAIGFMLLIIRPILYTDYVSGPDPGVGTVIEIQKQLGEPLEERSYTEMTYYWLVWYLGEVLVLMGVIGLLISVYKSLRKTEPALVLITVVVSISAALYLLIPSITPDQVWAVRRFLPVIIPGFIILAIFTLQFIDDKYFSKDLFTRKVYYAFASLVVIYLVAQPLVVSRPFLKNNEKPKHAEAIHSLCKQLPDNALVVWVGNTFELDAVQTTRAYCNVSSVGLNVEGEQMFADKGSPENIKLRAIKRAADRNGLVTYLAINGSQKPKFSDRAQEKFSFVTSFRLNEVQRTLLFAPKHVKPSIDSLELAKIGVDGVIVTPNPQGL